MIASPPLPRFYYLPDEFCITLLSETARQVDAAIAQLSERLSSIDERLSFKRSPVTLALGEQALTTLTLRLGAEGSDTPPAAQRRAVEVRALVNQLNTQRRDWATNLPGVIIAAALPNFLTMAAQNGYTGGGSGSSPEPIDPSLGQDHTFGRFSFPKDAALDALVAAQRKASPQHHPVTVAILDSWPAKAPTGASWLVDQVLPSGMNYQIKLEHLPHSPIADHGLFVAGIINDIAPAARLHAIRVLDDYCVGTWSDLQEGLAKLQSLEGHLVVNLSLGFLPTEDLQQMEREFAPALELGKVFFAQPGVATDATAREGERHLFRAIMYATFAALTTRDKTLLIASVGNDARPHEARPDPEFPARYDSLLSVAAIDAAEMASAFSNRGDIANTPLNGIAVLGGNTVAIGSTTIATIPGSVKKKDAVVGLYSAAFPGYHRAGWAYWAGTSFAAPIISGLAANIWANDPLQTAAEVKQTILDHGQGAVADLGCKYITAVQDIQE